MKKFWSDYVDLCKHSCRWMKDHWKGYILLIVIIYAATFIWLARDYIIDSIKEKFNKKDETEVEA